MIQASTTENAMNVINLNNQANNGPFAINIIMQALDCSEAHAKLVYSQMDMTDFSEATKAEIMLDAVVANMLLDEVV
jgi:hypothetical protein